MFGHSASLHEAGALPNSLSPETAKGTRGDDLIVAPLARSLMVNIAHLRKLNEAYTGRTAWVALADRRGRRHRPGCGFIVGGCGRPRNSGALSGPRRGGPCRRMRGVLYDRHFSASRGTFQVSTTSYTEGTQNHRIHILFSRRSVSARLT
jgi:hypothetical protein